MQKENQKSFAPRQDKKKRWSGTELNARGSTRKFTKVIDKN